MYNSYHIPRDTVILSALIQDYAQSALLVIGSFVTLMPIHSVVGYLNY